MKSRRVARLWDEQVLAPPRGFIWRARVLSGLLRLSGADLPAEKLSAHGAHDGKAVDFPGDAGQGGVSLKPKRELPRCEGAAVR